MKIIKSLLFAFLMLLAMNAISSVYIRYYNKDAKDYNFTVKIGNEMKKVQFGSSRSSSVVVAGGGSECVIFSMCGEIALKTNTKIVIENGCIKLQYTANERKD